MYSKLNSGWLFIIYPPQSYWATGSPSTSLLFFFFFVLNYLWNQKVDRWWVMCPWDWILITGLANPYSTTNPWLTAWRHFKISNLVWCWTIVGIGHVHISRTLFVFSKLAPTHICIKLCIYFNLLFTTLLCE